MLWMSMTTDISKIFNPTILWRVVNILRGSERWERYGPGHCGSHYTIERCHHNTHVGRGRPTLRQRGTDSDRLLEKSSSESRSLRLFQVWVLSAPHSWPQLTLSHTITVTQLTFTLTSHKKIYENISWAVQDEATVISDDHCNISDIELE